MTSLRFDVLGLGNAIVDVLARVEDDFLVREGLAKGSMALIDEARASELYGKIGQTILISGGSAANTLAGVASLGGKAAFIGKVRNDDLGKSFAHDIRAAGVHFETAAATDGPITASSTILITPDGERTMNTFLGASQHLKPSDVDADVVRASGTIYLEGYLWDPPEAKKAFLRASEIAHEAGRLVALTLSDSFCVGRYRGEFLDLIRSGKVDLVFANEHEAKALYETADFDSAISALRNDARSAVVTRSEKGGLFVTREETVAVPAQPIDKVVDATGAGDLYAAGVLAGFARGLEAAESLRLGALAAAEVLSHIGARPQVKLADLAAENGFLQPA
jgi:sugar/nucleoside kinase (ribokinase family)